MELISGSSLEGELGKGRRFDGREVVRIAVEVCKALRHAHDRGIIHRDIKPGNLLLAADGQVKMADFGIARFFGNSKLTITGSIIGTAEYMSPEQAAGRPVEPRSDLYSLGAVMYVLLARRQLFMGKSLREVLHKQQYEIPEPLRHFNPEVPEDLERLIAKLLEKEPERRVPNAMVLGRLLESMQETMGTPGETIAADASKFLSLETGEKTPKSLLQSADDEAAAPGDCPPTGEFSPGAERQQAAYVEPSSDPLAPTIATDGFPILATESDEKETAKETVKPHGRFIPVSKEDLGRDKDEIEEPRPTWVSLWISLQTWMLIASLLAVGGGRLYFLLPPSADSLYNRIASRIGDDESTNSIKSAEDDIKNFLDQFPNDSRAGKIRGYRYEIELDKFDRELPNSSNSAPIVRAYLDAAAFAQSDPEKGVAKLQAVIDLYASKSDAPGSVTGNCVELARRYIKQLKQELEAHAADQLPQITDRLDRADSLKDDDPQRAEAMYRAVLELYSDKAWAAQAVNRAKAALESQKTKK
jgi:serine/threonine-protein kinase